MILQKILNINIRLLGLALKFFFVIWLAKNSPEQILGQYGLIASFIVFSTILLGVEFYTFSNREIILETSLLSRTKIVSKQFALYLVTYSVVLPTAYFVITVFNWTSEVAWLIIIVMAFDHFTAELSRLLIALKMQFQSSISLFLRTACWMLPVIVIHEGADLYIILHYWFFGILASLIYSLILLNEKLVFKSLVFSFERDWYIRGIKVCSIYLLSSLSVVALGLFDKYYVDQYIHSGGLSVFVLYIGIANALVSIFDAGIAVYLYPKLIKHFQLGEYKLWYKEIKKSLFITAMLVTIYVLVLYILKDVLIAYFEKPVYVQYVDCLFVLVFALGVKVISTVFHFAFYSSKKDVLVMWTNAIPLFFLLLACFTLKTNSLIYFSWLVFLGYILQLFVRVILFRSLFFKDKYVLSN